MKPFHFSLELVRTLRQQKEQSAQQRYAAALAASREAELPFQRAVAELAAGRNLFNQKLQTGLTGSGIAELRSWGQVLEIRCKERLAALNRARHAAEAARLEMLAAARERESLDRFYDKARLAHNRASQREEQNTIDELAVQLNSTPGPLQSSGRNP